MASHPTLEEGFEVMKTESIAGSATAPMDGFCFGIPFRRSETDREEFEHIWFVIRPKRDSAKFESFCVKYEQFADSSPTSNQEFVTLGDRLCQAPPPDVILRWYSGKLVEGYPMDFHEAYHPGLGPHSEQKRDAIEKIKKDYPLLSNHIFNGIKMLIFYPSIVEGWDATFYEYFGDFSKEQLLSMHVDWM